MPIEFCSGTGGGGGLPAVENFTATANADSRLMDLAWTDYATELSYVIEISTDNITYTYVTALAAGTTSYQADGLTQDTLYYFRIRGVTDTTMTLPAVDSDTTTAYVVIPGATDPTTAHSRWRADDFNDVTGAVTDSGSEGYDLSCLDTATELPTLDSDWINSRPAMVFDGSDRLQRDDSGSGAEEGYTKRQTAGGDNGDFCLIIAGEWDGSYAEIYTEACTSGAGSWWTRIILDSTAPDRLQVLRRGGTNNITLNAANNSIASGLFVLAIRVIGSTCDAWWNRTQILTAGSLDGNDQSCFLDWRSVGASSYFTSTSPINPFTGPIGEVVIWGGTTGAVPSEATFLTHRDFLHNYYTIPY